MTPNGDTDQSTPSGYIVVDLRWPGVPTDPYLVPFPRVPSVGETIIGPDGMTPLTVTAVTYRFDSGFYFAPTSIVVETSNTGGEPHDG